MGAAAVTAGAHPAKAAPEPTLEQYRLAYRQINRPGWPSFDEAMASRVHRICLAGIARNLARPPWQPAPAAAGMPRGPAVPPTPTQPPPRTAAVPAGGAPHIAQGRDWRKRGIDLKRAAANDIDRDD